MSPSSPHTSLAVCSIMVDDISGVKICDHQGAPFPQPASSENDGNDQKHIEKLKLGSALVCGVHSPVWSSWVWTLVHRLPGFILALSLQPSDSLDAMAEVIELSSDDEDEQAQSEKCVGLPKQRKWKASSDKLVFDPGANKCKIFVSGLPFGCSEDDVKKIFESMGTIEAVQRLFFVDKKTKCNGQAYVTFSTEDAAKRSVSKIDGAASSKGKYLKVTPCRSRAITKSKSSLTAADTEVPNDPTAIDQSEQGLIETDKKTKKRKADIAMDAQVEEKKEKKEKKDKKEKKEKKEKKVKKEKKDKKEKKEKKEKKANKKAVM